LGATVQKADGRLWKITIALVSDVIIVRERLEVVTHSQRPSRVDLVWKPVISVEKKRQVDRFISKLDQITFYSSRQHFLNELDTIAKKR
jgi:hypothetical protein